MALDLWDRSRRVETPDSWAVSADEQTAVEVQRRLAGPPYEVVASSERRQTARQLGREPVTVGLSGSLALALASSLIVAAMGLVLTAIVGGRERRPAFAVLRAMGTRAAELRRWLLFETVPLVGFSALAGLVAGIALARLALPSLGVGRDGSSAVPGPQLRRSLGHPGGHHRDRGDGRHGTPGRHRPPTSATPDRRRAPDRGHDVIAWASLVGMGRRTEIAVWATMVTLLSIIAFGAVAAPRALQRAEQASLEQALEDAPIGARRLAVRVIADFPRGVVDDPLRLQRQRLDEIEAGLPPHLLERFVDSRFVADSSRFAVAADGGPALGEPVPPALPTFLTFRVHPELDEHSELVAGRRAAPTDRVIDGSRVFEFELSPETAAELGWEIGDVVLLTLDPNDLVTRSFDASLPPDFVGELVGLRELSDPSEPYWFGDARAHRATVADTGVGANVFAFGMVHPEQLASRPFLASGRSPFALEQRRDLDVERLTLQTLDETIEAALALEAAFSTQPTLTRPGVVNSLAPGDRDRDRPARCRSVDGRARCCRRARRGPGDVDPDPARCRRARGGAGSRVARARGASRPQVVAAAMAEMALIATLAVAIGGGAALTLFPSAASDLEVRFRGGELDRRRALCRVRGDLGGTPSSHGVGPPDHPSGTGAVGKGRWRRALAVTVAAVVTFRRRGVDTDASGADLLVVLLPVLVPLSVVSLMRWAVPVAARWATRRGLALGPGRLVGLRRVTTDPQPTLGVVAVIVLALTVAALGMGVERHSPGVPSTRAGSRSGPTTGSRVGNPTSAPPSTSCPRRPSA